MHVTVIAKAPVAGRAKIARVRALIGDAVMAAYSAMVATG